MNIAIALCGIGVICLLILVAGLMKVSSITDRQSEEWAIKHGYNEEDEQIE